MLAVVSVLIAGCGSIATPERVVTIQPAQASSSAIAGNLACRVIEVHSLSSLFGHALDGPILGKSQTPGGVSCAYGDVGAGELVSADYYGDMTASEFSAQAYFASPMPSEWSNSVPLLGDQTMGWLLSGGEGVVAFRKGENVVVITVGIAAGTPDPKTIFSDAVNLAAAAERQ
jgi:hypothetical protein